MKTIFIICSSQLDCICIFPVENRKNAEDMQENVEETVNDAMDDVKDAMDDTKDAMEEVADSLTNTMEDVENHEWKLIVLFFAKSKSGAMPALLILHGCLFIWPQW